jgi:hypothetical protein
LNPSVFYNGINIVYLSGVSGELLHNTFGDLQGGSTGQYYHLSSGQYFNLITGAVVRPNETGSFLTIGSADLRYVGLAGDQTISGAKAFVLRPSVNGTGVMLSGEAVSVNTGELTGAFYPLNSNPSNYITGSVVRPSETGVFYPTSNPSGYITGVDLSAYVTGNVVRPSETGNFITASQTGAFYAASNPSGFITGVNLSNYSTIAFSTGISGSLQNQITNLNNQTGNYYPTSNPSGFITGVDLSFSGNYYTKSESESRYVNTTGAETILGDKTFHDKVYINNLYVTGLETIVNTTNTNIASNFIMLNLTGGAVDGGLFFVTGAGLTGINDSGAILGFDHSDKFKFGIGTRASDLSVLDTIASVEEMTGISGSLQTQISSLSNATGSYVLNSQTGVFYPTSNPSGFITGVDLSPYATITNLAATGSTLQTNINNLSGVYATISNLNSTGSSLDSKINLLSGSSVLLYGNQTISGIKSFTTGVNISGNLTVDANTLFVDAANNKVGIGTSSSLIGKLDVAGSLTTTTPSDVLVLSRPYNPGVAFHTAASFRLSNPNTNVINTRLDIALQSGNTSSPVTPDTTVMTLLGDGRVGIGTTSPTSKLHVSNGSAINGAFSTYWTTNDIILSADTGVSNAMRLVRASDTATTRSSLNFIKSRGTLASPTALQENDTVGDLLFGGYGVGGIGYGGGLFAYVDGAVGPGADCPIRLSFVAGSNAADRQERLTVKSNGNIGIGTITPNERLTVSGNISASGNVSANNLVYNTGNQTISGVKDFQTKPTVVNVPVLTESNLTEIKNFSIAMAIALS